MGNIVTTLRANIIPSIDQVLTIAGLTIREAWRRRFLAVALGLGAACVALFGVGVHFARLDVLARGAGYNLFTDSAFNMMVMAGLYAESFLGIMAGVLIAVPAMAGKIASHTLDVLAVKPFRRAPLVVGKWLGLACMLTLYVGTPAAGTIGVTWAISGHVPPHPVEGAALMALEAIVLMSITLFAGTRLSVVATGALSLGLYGLAFIGGWLEQIGAFTRNDALVDIGIVTSFLVPSETTWKKAAHLMQPTVVNDFGFTPFAVANPPSAAMVIYTIIYVLAMVVAAVYALERRDL